MYIKIIDHIEGGIILGFENKFVNNKTITTKRKRFNISGNLTKYLGTGIILLLLGIWLLITETGIVQPLFLPSPITIIETLFILIVEGYNYIPMWQHVLASVLRALVGFGLAVILGVPLGLLMGYNKYMYAIFGPIFAFLRPIPPIAYVPLMVLWFGIGETSKVLMIFLAAFLYINLNCMNGIRTVPNLWLQAGRNLGLNHGKLFFRVIVPSAMPSIFTGIKTGLAVSWSILVAAELIVAQQGLGFMIMDAATFYRIPIVYVGVGLIGLIGVILDFTVSQLEKRILHWTGK